MTSRSPALEDERARVAAQLGGVDPDPVEQVEACRRTAPPRQRELQAAVGLGADRTSNAAHRAALRGVVQPLLLGLGDVQALQVEREAGRRQRAAEAAHQLVVAAAAAEDVAERRVVDLEDRAGVVAEVAQQAEVEADPVGDAARARARSNVAASRRGRALGRRRRRGARACSSTSGRRAACGSRTSSSRSSAAEVERRDLRLEARRGRGSRGTSSSRARGLVRDAELGEQLAVEVGVAEPDHRAASARPRRAPRPAPRPPRRCPRAPAPRPARPRPG